MELTVFSTLATILAGYIAWNLMPAGFKKLTDIDGNLPTFQSLFGRLATFVLVAVGFIELTFPGFLVVTAVLTNEFFPIFAGGIAFVMFGAIVIHTAIWKNSPKQPLTLFVVTLAAVVFNGLAFNAKASVETEPLIEVVADTTVVDSTKVDTLPIVTDTVPE